MKPQEKDRQQDNIAYKSLVEMYSLMSGLYKQIEISIGRLADDKGYESPDTHKYNPFYMQRL